MTSQMASKVEIPSSSIPINMIQPPIGLKDQIKIGKVSINHLTQSISDRSHNLRFSNKVKENEEQLVICTCIKPS